jgi:RNA polymerase sigma-32 factor
MQENNSSGTIKYLKKSIYQPPLEREQEHQLARRWHLYKDEKALHQLVESHFRLVINQVYRFRNYGLSSADLNQEGMIGLLKAAMRFDPKLHDIRFSGYAKWWVKSYIQDYILRNWSIVRVGSTTAHKQLFFNLNRLKNQILNVDYNSLSKNEMSVIADALNVTVRDVEKIEQRLSSLDLSLDFTFENEYGVNSCDIFPDPAPNPEEISSRRNTQRRCSAWINKAFEALNEKERKIIEARFFKEEETFCHIGKKLGLSSERIRQLEKRAFRKMRHELAHNQKIKKEDVEAI